MSVPFVMRRDIGKKIPKSQNRNKNTHANVALNDDESDYVLTIASNCVASATELDSWLLDSNCS